MLALRAVARRVQQLTAEEREPAREIEQLTSSSPRSYSTSPASAHCSPAQIVSLGHTRPRGQRGRIRQARGVATIPASSGQTIRHRLDRSGDDNSTERSTDRPYRGRTPADHRLHQRRVREGKSRREATRCLKRYLARNLYRLLENPPLTTDKHRSIPTRKRPSRAGTRGVFPVFACRLRPPSSFL